MERSRSTSSSRPVFACLAGLAAALGLAVTSTACGASLHEVTGKASRDMECPVSALTVTDVDSTTRKVDGCGKSELYVEDCSKAPPCTWTNKRRLQ